MKMNKNHRRWQITNNYEHICIDIIIIDSEYFDLNEQDCITT